MKIFLGVEVNVNVNLEASSSLVSPEMKMIRRDVVAFANYNFKFQHQNLHVDILDSLCWLDVCLMPEMPFQRTKDGFTTGQGPTMKC